MSDLYEQLRHALTADAEPSDTPRGMRWLPKELPVWLVVAVSLFSLSLFAYLDVTFGKNVHFGYVYSVPVLFSAWYAGRRTALLVAVAASAAWFIAEWQERSEVGAPFYAFCWNWGSRLFVMALAILLLSRLRTLSQHLGELVDVRTAALRRLAAQLSQAEDGERRRLAHDIHDGLSQTLSLLKLNLAGTLQESGQNADVQKRLADAMGMVNELIERSRTMVFDLHPAMLEHLGLVSTLRHHAEQFSRQANIEVVVNEDGPSRVLPPTTANYLFRSIKEIMNNAANHGRARQIIVSVYWSMESVRVAVDDDGVGFDPAKLLAAEAGKGLGLAAIHERLLSLGGGMELESSEGKGTRVALSVPLSAEGLTV